MPTGKHISCYTTTCDGPDGRQSWIEALIDLAQLYALTVLLDPVVVSEHTRCKLDRIFRKLGQVVLVGDIQDVTKIQEGSNPKPRILPGALMHDFDLLRYADNLFIAAQFRQLLTYLSTALGINIDSAKTYRDIYELIDTEIIEPSNLQRFSHEIAAAAAADLGVPRRTGMSEQVLSEIVAILSNKDLITLTSEPHHHQALLSNDVLLFRVHVGMIKDRLPLAFHHKNVVSLCSPFFKSHPYTSFADIEILPGTTTISTLFNHRVATLLHECFHSPSVLGAADHYGFQVVEIPGKLYKRFSRYFGTKMPKKIGKSSLYRSFLLQYLDTRNGSRMAEDNADTWANYAVARIFLLAYPEYSFNVSISHRVQRREQLLHHYSGFDCLRHPSAGSITHLPDYEVAKDLWATNHGTEKPTNVKELLGVLQELVGKHDSNQYATPNCNCHASHPIDPTAVHKFVKEALSLCWKYIL